MHHDFRLRIARLGLEHGVTTEFDMRVTIPLPQRHRTSGLFHYPLTEIFVRDKQQVFILWRSIDNFFRVTAGDDHVAKGFDRRAAIDVGDGPEVWIGFLQRLKFLCRATFFQRTTGVLVRQHDDLAGVQNFRRLSHEMNTAEDDDVCVGLFRLLREAERITDVIRHILNLRHLIIVREYDGVQLFLERADFSGERGETFAAHRRAKLEAVCWRQLEGGGVHHKQRLMPRAVGVNLWRVGECATRSGGPRAFGRSAGGLSPAARRRCHTHGIVSCAFPQSRDASRGSLALRLMRHPRSFQLRHTRCVPNLRKSVLRTQ